MDSREPKQVIVIRRDLAMRRGKEIAQGSHASMAWLVERYRHAASFAFSLSDAEREWLIAGKSAKIVAQVPDEQALFAVYERARAAGVEVHLITDAGRTEFAGVPTRTALAVGPDYSDRIDPITRDLKLY
jgi:PTH2 family peptidyl-tRNA hydrolase